MPSTYTASLRLTLPATGELAGTWGTTVNTGITALTDTAIAGYASVTMTDADLTLTSNDGASDQARNMMLNMTGTLTAARNVICPTASKLYIFKNSTTGGFATTLKTSGGSGVSVPNGKSMLLMCDGTNVVEASTNVGALTGTSFAGAVAATTLTTSSTATLGGGAQTTSVAVTFSATAMTVNCALSNVFTTTFTANVTVAPAFSNLADGQTINWFITQDATGTRTMTWPTSFKWAGASAGVLSTAANSVDLLVATYRSSTGFWYASLSKGFA